MAPHGVTTRKAKAFARLCKKQGLTPALQTGRKLTWMKALLDAPTATLTTRTDPRLPNGFRALPRATIFAESGDVAERPKMRPNLGGWVEVL